MQHQQNQRLAGQHGPDAADYGPPAESGGEPITVGRAEQAGQRKRDDEQPGAQGGHTQALLPEDGEDEEECGEAGEIQQGEKLVRRERAPSHQPNLDHRLPALAGEADLPQGERSSGEHAGAQACPAPRRAYPETTHSRSAGRACRPNTMLGRATFMIVVSSTAMNAPTSTTARICHSREPGLSRLLSRPPWRLRCRSGAPGGGAAVRALLIWLYCPVVSAVAWPRTSGRMARPLAAARAAHG